MASKVPKPSSGTRVPETPRRPLDGLLGALETKHTLDSRSEPSKTGPYPVLPAGLGPLQFQRGDRTLLSGSLLLVAVFHFIMTFGE